MTSRIMIIGGPGAGKTTLARRLAGLTGLPVHAVDDAVRDAEGRQRPDADIDAMVRGWAAGDAWIIEGGNTRTYPDRAARADLIIRITPGVWRRLFRVLRRDGFNLQLLRWTLRYDRVFGPKDRAICAGAASVVVKDGGEIERLMATIGRGARPEQLGRRVGRHRSGAEA